MRASTPINIDVLEFELTRHPDRVFVNKLIHGLREGFSTGMSQVPSKSYVCKNLASTKKFPDAVTAIIKTEIDKGYLLGPFDDPPFATYRISPIGVVEKKYGGKMRLIVDLSAPHENIENPSINELINKEEFSLSYVRIDDAIKVIRGYGTGSWLSKLDIVDAYKIIPIHPQEWCMYGIQWLNKCYFYHRLVFGSRSSPKLFDMLSTAICWIAENNYHIEAIFHLLDDFLSIDRPDYDADRTMALLTMIFNKLRVPLSPSKTVGPTQVLEYLGIILDTLRMEARLPIDKLQRLIALIDSFLARSKCTKRELLSLLGHLNFACRVVIPGRTFISRLLVAATKVSELYHHVYLDSECKADMLMWKHFLDNWNGISLFLDDKFTMAGDMELFTDASGKYGIGGYFHGEWFASTWPIDPEYSADLSVSIAFQELYPIVVSAILWGHSWSRKRIVFRSDNMATVCILNKGRSKCPVIMKLMRRLVLLAGNFSFAFYAEHICGVKNTIADSLSRQQFRRFRQLAPNAAEFPLPCPEPSSVMFG
jgi:hypothetical protein